MKAKPSGSSGRSLSRFLQHEAIESISTPPWMGCQSIRGQPFIHLGGERHCESKVSCPRTQHNVPRPRLEPRPLAPEQNALTMWPLHMLFVHFCDMLVCWQPVFSLRVTRTSVQSSRETGWYGRVGKKARREKTVCSLFLLISNPPSAQQRST